MKALFVYDNPEVKGQLIKDIPCAYVYTINAKGGRPLYDVAVDIKREARAEDIIFIDQYLACADEDFEWLQQSAGIALIKFLRMLEVRNHIVLITPFAGREMELIKINPANLIVTSKGISFSKNLLTATSKTIDELLDLSTETFGDKQDLKPYILAEFRLPEDERHNWANWWGVDRLWHIHSVVEKEKFDSRDRRELEDYPKTLKKQIEELRNLQALFLYGHKDSIINQELERLKSVYEDELKSVEKNEQTIELLRMQHTDKHTKLSVRITLHHNAIKNFPIMLSGANVTLLKHIKDSILTPQRYQELLSEVETLEAVLDSVNTLADSQKEEAKQRLEAIEASIDEERENIIRELETIINTQKSKIRNLQIPALRKELIERHPRILYIDDQANEGWSDIFQHIIYDKKEDINFKVIQPIAKEVSDGESLSEKARKEIEEFKPDILLLDLRLKKESGFRMNVEELSGAVLLKEIKQRFQGIPVLMTTASNKSWSYEELQQIGCDAFWTKEGIDTAMSEQDSVRNYLRFVELVNILSDKEYKFAKWFYAKVQEIHGSPSFWWWEGGKYAERGREAIVPILEHTGFLIQQYLKNEIINPRKQEQTKNWLLPALIVHNYRKVIELIYRNNKEDITFHEIAKELYREGNAASHIVAKGENINSDNTEKSKTAEDFTFEDAMTMSEKCIEYLMLGNAPPLVETKPKDSPNPQVDILKNIERTKRKR